MHGKPVVKELVHQEVEHLVRVAIPDLRVEVDDDAGAVVADPRVRIGRDEQREKHLPSNRSARRQVRAKMRNGEGDELLAAALHVSQQPGGRDQARRLRVFPLLSRQLVDSSGCLVIGVG